MNYHLLDTVLSIDDLEDAREARLIEIDAQLSLHHKLTGGR